MRADVELIQGNRRCSVRPGEDASVAEGTLTIQVDLDRRAEIEFDDVPQGGLWSRDGRSVFVQVDLTNQIGYHRLVLIDGDERLSFDFRTDSTKAAWDAIQAMALHIGRQALAYRKQFTYSTASGPRRAVVAPQVAFGWMRDRLPEIGRHATSIVSRPAQSRTVRSITTFQSAGLDLPRTSALLRNRPSYLEESPGGPLKIAGREYWPTAIRARRSRNHWPEVEHRQIAQFLRELAVTCNRLVDEIPAREKQRVASWISRLSALRRSPAFRSYDRIEERSPLVAVPTEIQRSDVRYRRLRQLHHEFRRDFAQFRPSVESVRTNIKDVWEIFQSFTAQMLGHALGLSYVAATPDLRIRDGQGRSMTSESIDLYYDIAPPADLLPSWRAETDRPANERPDIVIHDKKNGLIAVVDAKFRKDLATDRAVNDDLFEMQAYLQSFRLSRGGIAFPSLRQDCPSVAAQGFEILEIPINPDATSEVVLDILRQALGRLWQPIPDAN